MKDEEKEGTEKDSFVHKDGFSHFTACLDGASGTVSSLDLSVAVGSESVSDIVVSFPLAKKVKLIEIGLYI